MKYVALQCIEKLHCRAICCIENTLQRNVLHCNELRNFIAEQYVALQRIETTLQCNKCIVTHRNLIAEEYVALKRIENILQRNMLQCNEL